LAQKSSSGSSILAAASLSALQMLENTASMGWSPSICAARVGWRCARLFVRARVCARVRVQCARVRRAYVHAHERNGRGCMACTCSASACRCSTHTGGGHSAAMRPWPAGRAVAARGTPPHPPTPHLAQAVPVVADHGVHVLKVRLQARLALRSR
jgi:hypothetical protein